MTVHRVTDMLQAYTRLANIECELVQVVQPGDCPLVIGRVVAGHVSEDETMRRLYSLAKGYVLGGVRPAIERLAAEDTSVAAQALQHTPVPLIHQVADTSP